MKWTKKVVSPFKKAIWGIFARLKIVRNCNESRKVPSKALSLYLTTGLSFKKLTKNLR